MLATKLHLHGLYVILVLVALEVAAQHKIKRTRVPLADGIVEGKEVKSVGQGKTFYSFQGVPYAKPPVGDLRFAPPQPPEKWSTILDATKPGKTCIELFFSDRGSEDCLYLNVYTPALHKSLPVLLWIHGGAYIYIYPNHTLSGADYFMDEEVVFVTINYRMGVFGFISTEDDIIPGNYGLKDQAAAISWVHENIHAFGGDPKKITLMGQSAGGSSASLLAMGPHLEGKIAGIIQESGSALMRNVLGRYHRVGAYVLSTRLGLQTQNSSAILERLRQVDAETLRNESLITFTDITEGIGSFQGGLYIPGLEIRTVKDAVLTEMPYEQLKKGNILKVPRMIGFVSVEAMYLTRVFERYSKTYQNYDQMPRRFIPTNMNTRDEHVGNLIKQHYTGGAPFVGNVSNVVHYASDDQFARAILKDASLVSKHVPTYLYEFTYEGELGEKLQGRDLKGVVHTEEVEYLFYHKDQGKVNEKDQLVRRRLVRLWSNFAKYGVSTWRDVSVFRLLRTGAYVSWIDDEGADSTATQLPKPLRSVPLVFCNPTPTNDQLLGNKIWPRINPASKDVDYMNLGEELVPSTNPHHEDVKFWDDLYAKYGNPPYDTY